MILTLPVYALASSYVILSFMILGLAGGGEISHTLLVAIALMSLPLCSSLLSLRDSRLDLESSIGRIDISIAGVLILGLFILLGVSLELLLLLLFYVLAVIPLSQKGVIALGGASIALSGLFGLLMYPDIATLLFGVGLYSLIVYLIRALVPQLSIKSIPHSLWRYLYYIAIYVLVILLMLSSYREIDILYIIILLLGVALLHNTLALKTHPHIPVLASYAGTLMLGLIALVPHISLSGLSTEAQYILLVASIPLILVITALWNRLLR